MVDTTVLIDLWRCRRQPGRLRDLQTKAGTASLVLTWIVEAEFSRGAVFKGVSWESLEAFCSDFHYAGLTRAGVKRYATLWAELAKVGRAPHYPDLWIAATALERNSPVLTRNPAHFQEVPGLEVVSYQLPEH
jgi:predicted nucleic acid-binding protein